MKTATFVMLTKAMEGIQENREVLIQVAGKSFAITKLTNDAGDDGAAYATAVTGVRVIFDASKLEYVIVGPERT